jgi:lysine N6-hydroxylase
MSNIFLEQKDDFGWHDGQQVPGATLQVSFFKDLVSLCQPTNVFSFLSYLHEQGKIYHFVNAQFDAVPRQEFRNYLRWASRNNENIAFSEKVLEVNFDGDFIIRTSNRTLTAESISIGVGIQPWVPPAGQDRLGETQFHVSEFVPRATNLGGKRVAVVGGGQSGAEAFLALISRSREELPRRVTWISRRGNFFPIDDTPFTNEYYTPSYSDYFSSLEPDIRRTLVARHVLTSDGISGATLREIYQRSYVHRFVEGNTDLLSLLPNKSMTAVAGNGIGGWDITIQDNDRTDLVEHVNADVVIWATGFRSADMDFLDPIAPRLERTGHEYRIDQDFAVCWDGPRDRPIFMQNAAREQRGLADPNLSLIAWRSQRIIDRLRGVRSDDQLASFIEWPAERPASEIRAG